MGGGGRGIIAVYRLRAATVTGVEMLSNSALWELFMISNSQPIPMNLQTKAYII